MNRKSYLILFLCLPLLLSSCGTMQKKDPFEPFNRAMFELNNDLDMMIVRPAAEIYRVAVPEPVNKGISNFFSNLGELTVIANDLLQLKFQQALRDSGRFAINSTLGLLGFFDVARHWGLEKNYEDFGQTLGFWGVQPGPYLYLPALGPSSVRDFAGRGVDIFTDPRNYAGTSSSIINLTRAVEVLDIRAGLIDMENILDTAALDKYSYIREAYLSRREYLVYDGNPPREEVDENFLFDDDELFAE
jgi:phospholipid-binding lipoprotein MlaA